MVFPGLAIMLTVLGGFNLLGDGLRDVCWTKDETLTGQGFPVSRPIGAEKTHFLPLRRAAERTKPGFQESPGFSLICLSSNARFFASAGRRPHQKKGGKAEDAGVLLRNMKRADSPGSMGTKADTPASKWLRSHKPHQPLSKGEPVRPFPSSGREGSASGSLSFHISFITW